MSLTDIESARWILHVYVLQWCLLLMIFGTKLISFADRGEELDRERAESFITQLEGIKTALKDDLWGVLYILNGSAHPDLTPALKLNLLEVAKDLQVLSGMAHEANTIASTSTATQRQATRGLGLSQSLDTTEQRPKRRRSSKVFDYLVLEGIRQGRNWRPIIGQEELLKLAKAMDENTKKDSLISKLNRWRNDKRWVDWSDPVDLRLTPEGNEAREKLLIYTKSQDRIEEVNAAFKMAWSYDVTS